MEKKTRIMKKRISRTKKRMRKNGKNKKKKDEEDQVLDHPDNDIHGETRPVMITQKNVNFSVEEGITKYTYKKCFQVNGKAQTLSLKPQM